MRDFDKPYRKAIYDSLNGNISGYKVFDEVRAVSETVTLFVLFGEQRSTPDILTDTDCAYARRCSIDLLIVDKRGMGVSKDDIDTLSNIVLERLFTTDFKNLNVTVPSGYSFSNSICEASRTGAVQLNSTEILLSKTLTITTTIIQQN